MKTPISYYGGKQRMASKIVPLIPKHTVYVEPFAGGAAVMFAKGVPAVTSTSHYREVINDIDGDLINFYKQLRDNGEALARAICMTPYSEREHRQAKDRAGCDDLERARRYFVAIKQSFLNRLDSGWRRAKYGRNFAATWASAQARIWQYIDRMQGVSICNDDALKIIKQWDSPQTFFYCDPPYPNAEQGHYSGYTIDDFQALIDTLNACEGAAMLSNYPQDVTGLDEWERHEFSAHSSAAAGKNGKGKGQRTEVVWIKQADHTNLRPELAKVMQGPAFDAFGEGAGTCPA